MSRAVDQCKLVGPLIFLIGLVIPNATTLINLSRCAVRCIAEAEECNTCLRLSEKRSQKEAASKRVELLHSARRPLHRVYEDSDVKPRREAKPLTTPNQKSGHFASASRGGN